MDSKIIIYCTVPNDEVAREIATQLVERNVAACVNIVPSLVSVYFWKGEVCTDDELLLVIKTTGKMFDEVSRVVKSMHPYVVPELVAVPVVDGSSDYLQWIDDCVSG